MIRGSDGTTTPEYRRRLELIALFSEWAIRCPANRASRFARAVRPPRPRSPVPSASTTGGSVTHPAADGVNINHPDGCCPRERVIIVVCHIACPLRPGLLRSPLGSDGLIGPNLKFQMSGGLPAGEWTSIRLLSNSVFDIARTRRREHAPRSVAPSISDTRSDCR